MRLEVLFFAHAARISGCHRERFDLPEGSTVAQALAAIVARHPRLRELEGTLQLAVGEELAAPERPLRVDETLAVLPPFSGG
ncbi:MAG TPA: MoaD/ThiS family protein [Candidatus Krumholzibacteria bacterium]|jgi:molybdopterin converting factor small subunit